LEERYAPTKRRERGGNKIKKSLLRRKIEEAWETRRGKRNGRSNCEEGGQG